MPSARDLTGQRFGRLTVIKREENKGKRIMWKCRCDCGNEIITRGDNLTSGGSKSCGCYNREMSTKAHKKHGKSNTRIYRIWIKMRGRCCDKKNDRYEEYGGRGITVCDEWLHDFQTFYDWSMSHGYTDDLTIDRIDVNGNYEPGNCRWATQKEQQNNRRDNHYLTLKGVTHTITEWARIKKLSENGLVHRINRGWDVEKALTTPMKTKNDTK